MIEELPGFDVLVWFGHGLQNAAPLVLEYVPCRHSIQRGAPKAPENFPTPQAMHSLAPGLEERPVPQSVQFR